MAFRSMFASLPVEFDRYPYLYLHSCPTHPTTFRVYSKGTYQLVQSVPLEHSFDLPSSYVGAVRENLGREYAFVENNYVYLMSRGTTDIIPYRTAVIKMSLTNFTWEKLNITTYDNTSSFRDGYVVDDFIYFVRSGALERPKIFKVRRNPLELVSSGGVNIAFAGYGVLVEPNFDRIYVLTQRGDPFYTRVSNFVLSTLEFVSHSANLAGGWMASDPTPKTAFTKRGPYVYYLSRTSQTDSLGNGRVVKANYPTSPGGSFTLHSTMVLPSGRGDSLCVDSPGTYGYTTSRAGYYVYIHKIRLSDLTVVKSYTYNPSNSGVDGSTAALDELNGLLYVLCYTVNVQVLLVFDLDLNLQGIYSVTWARSIFLVKE